MLSVIKGAGSSACRAGLKGLRISRCLSTSPWLSSKIIYTECDEAPMLATYSLLPVIQRFAKPMGIEVREILLLSQFQLNIIVHLLMVCAGGEERYLCVGTSHRPLS